MQRAKVNISFAFFPYGGTGGTSQIHPSIQKWFWRTMLAAKADPRVGDIYESYYADCPITMTRNKALKDARCVGADIIIMCDSDQHPDLYVADGAKPFWNSTFDFVYERKLKGLHTVVGAPYCGPPPMENVYVFRPANWETGSPNFEWRLEQYSREEAHSMVGIQPAAALPTGLIMMDLAIFDWLPKPWFYYEYVDEEESEKASTEDVTCTRDIALIGSNKFGYNPIYCNWDCWAGHYKPKCVGKPGLLTIEQIGENYKKTILDNTSHKIKRVFIDPEGRWRQNVVPSGNGVEVGK